LTGDSQEEIVVVTGVKTDDSAMLYIYKNGDVLTTLQAFAGNGYSARVAIGNLGY